VSPTLGLPSEMKLPSCGLPFSATLSLLFNIDKNELAYNLHAMKEKEKNIMVWGNARNVTRVHMVHSVVSRQVLIAYVINVLIIVSVHLNPVRLFCK
jgi:hypothetical protein